MGVFDKIKLPDVKKIIAIASGKGGVGKSTVAVNLATALQLQGKKTAIVDADIFGPSVPKMLGLEDARPIAEGTEEKPLIIPIEKDGLKVMSVGFFVQKGQSLIWRGPMAANAITQLFENTEWGSLDYLIIDFPPGTSDIQLTCVQKLNICGAILVTTPQEIALEDARKAGSMFLSKGLSVKIIGVVENMSWFTPKQHPEEKYFIFGKGGGQKLADEFNTCLLAQIPLVVEAGEAAENGKTVHSINDSSLKEIFSNLAQQLIKKYED
jgi:ATP-binding protein involved in chromosome partitioning